jgi:hypothetical protein
LGWDFVPRGVEVVLGGEGRGRCGVGHLGWLEAIGKSLRLELEAAGWRSYHEGEEVKREKNREEQQSKRMRSG